MKTDLERLEIITIYTFDNLLYIMESYHYGEEAKRFKKLIEYIKMLKDYYFGSKKTWAKIFYVTKRNWLNSVYDCLKRIEDMLDCIDKELDELDGDYSKIYSHLYPLLQAWEDEIGDRMTNR